MSQRITAQVQNTLAFLMNLLDRIQHKELPEKIDMIQSNQALPESAKIKTNRLNTDERKNIRTVVQMLQKHITPEDA